MTVTDAEGAASKAPVNTVPGEGDRVDGESTSALSVGLKGSVAADELAAEADAFKPFTREEADRFRQTQRVHSPWVLVGSQLLAGVVVALLAWMLTSQSRMGWSAAYGAAAVVLPSVLFVRGLSRQKNAAHGGSALAGFFVWEMVKIALTLAMLVAAPRLVSELNWLALLAGFVVTMKAYWAAVWFGLLRPKSIKNL